MFIIMIILSCVSTYMMPRVHQVYPGFLLCRFGSTFFSQIMYASPIQGDYVESSSQGKSSSLLSVFGGIGFISATGLTT